VLGNVFEGEQEAGKIFVPVKRIDLGPHGMFTAALP
jgi:hypothetical protein